MRDLSSRSRHVPVPEPLLEALLEEVDDVDELKCTLALVWLLQRKKDSPGLVSEGELLSDVTLRRALTSSGDPQAAIRRGVQKALARGIVLEVEAGVEEGPVKLYLLNDIEGQRTLDEIRRGRLSLDGLLTMETGTGSQRRPNIFALYEDNIGLLTPMLAEKLKEAEKRYPWSWIRDAFEEAVVRNARNWRYIESILERWATEGRGKHGKPGRHPETAEPEEYGRSYGRYVRD